MLNTEDFLQTTTTETLDDYLEPCPVGEWNAIAGKPVIATFKYKNGERAGETGFRMVIRWDVQDQNVKEQLGRDKVTVQQSLLLDVTPDQSGLDMGKGKNIGLGQVRTALNQNQPGQQWSPLMIEGQIAKIKVKHRVLKDENNPTDEGRILADVDAVTKAA